MGRGWKRTATGYRASPSPDSCFQGAQTEPAGEDFRRDFRERPENPDLDGADCPAADQVSAAPGHFRLVTVEFGGIVASAIVRLPRPVDLVERSLPATAGTPLRTTASAGGASLRGLSPWTAARAQD